MLVDMYIVLLQVQVPEPAMSSFVQLAHCILDNLLMSFSLGPEGARSESEERPFPSPCDSALLRKGSHGSRRDRTPTRTPDFLVAIVATSPVPVSAENVARGRQCDQLPGHPFATVQLCPGESPTSKRYC